VRRHRRLPAVCGRRDLPVRRLHRIDAYVRGDV
jgi:hypothetical protein